jgi:hypothetical protein
MTVVTNRAEEAPSMDLENDYDFVLSPAFAALSKDVGNISSSGGGLLKPLAPLALSIGNKAPLPKLGKLQPPPTLITIVEEPAVPAAKGRIETEAENAARRAAKKKDKALRSSRDGKSLRKSRDKALRHGRESADDATVASSSADNVAASVDEANFLEVAAPEVTSPAAGSLYPLVVGERVEARYGGKGTWFRGTIAAVHEEQTFDVAYDDGDCECGVARLRVRRCGEQQPLGLLAAGARCDARLGTKCFPATVTAVHASTAAGGLGGDTT